MNEIYYFKLKIINDYIYKRMGHKRIKYDESAWLQQLIKSIINNIHTLLHEINATIILTRRKLMRSEINANENYVCSV